MEIDLSKLKADLVNTKHKYKKLENKHKEMTSDYEYLLKANTKEEERVKDELQKYKDAEKNDIGSDVESIDTDSSRNTLLQSKIQLQTDLDHIKGANGTLQKNQ